jgi:nicotinate-nucleotide adenylyltransferase
MAVGIFGGTFDPVHLGHLGLADAARNHLGLHEIRWIPSGRPGHRVAPVASAEDRLAMLELALKGQSHAAIDSAELSGTEPTFTVNTLTRLRQDLRNTPLALIIGSDQFMALHTWRDWPRLFELAHIAVGERPGHPVAATELPDALAAEFAARRAKAIGTDAAGGIVMFPMNPMNISSTAIRTALSSGGNVSGLLPADVLAYIRSRHLYEAFRT